MLADTCHQESEEREKDTVPADLPHQAQEEKEKEFVEHKERKKKNNKKKHQIALSYYISDILRLQRFFSKASSRQYYKLQ